jgi:hypothetical protein
LDNLAVAVLFGDEGDNINDEAELLQCFGKIIEIVF